LVGSGLLVASACSSGASAPAAGSPYPPSTIAAAAAPPAPHSPGTIAVGQSQLGPIVVDGTGRTLYRFDKDMPGSATSACNGACAAAWPAALVTDQPVAGPGVSGALGAIMRADGTRQLTLDGHPLYRYVGDQGPGDTTGDGFGGIWHVVHTTGSAANTPPANTPAASGSPASVPPASMPPARTLPARTPLASTPPAHTPPANTLPARTPPASTPPASKPPATASPWPGY
jgi:predicted lipoprotein with Yx(FWY)xxD motif